jgi:hypothetical protein
VVVGEADIDLENDQEGSMSMFRAQRVVRSFTQELAAPASQVFPLLCPVREYDWIDGWNCELIYSVSGVVENNCVFRTNIHGDGERTWVVSHHDLENFAVGFVVMVGRSLVLKLDVALSDRGDGTTAAVWTNVLTALDEHGNMQIGAFTEEMFVERIKALETALNHYLRTGAMLRSSIYPHAGQPGHHA